MEIKYSEDLIHVLLQKSLYAEKVLYKCFYWYGGSFNVDIKDYSDVEFLVLLKPKEEVKEIQPIIDKIKRDLIDFKLREIVAKETQVLRELLVAKAFANFEEEDNDPSTDVSDPVGFNPLTLS
ncbi:MAG TPA: His-Xaa-Ser system protein HxsD [Pelobium sp.]|nr:His-Xaa-Ser system protein HxsD [Pelobium sp.]